MLNICLVNYSTVSQLHMMLWCKECRRITSLQLLRITYWRLSTKLQFWPDCLRYDFARWNWVLQRNQHLLSWWPEQVHVNVQCGAGKQINNQHTSITLFTALAHKIVIVHTTRIIASGTEVGSRGFPWCCQP